MTQALSFQDEALRNRMERERNQQGGWAGVAALAFQTSAESGSPVDGGGWEGVGELLKDVRAQEVLSSPPGEATAPATSHLLARSALAHDQAVAASKQVASLSRSPDDLLRRIVELHQRNGFDMERTSGDLAAEGWDKSLITPDALVNLDDQLGQARSAGDVQAFRTLEQARAQLIREQRVNTPPTEGGFTDKLLGLASFVESQAKSGGGLGSMVAPSEQRGTMTDLVVGGIRGTIDAAANIAAVPAVLAQKLSKLEMAPGIKGTTPEVVRATTNIAAAADRFSRTIKDDLFPRTNKPQWSKEALLNDFGESVPQLGAAVAAGAATGGGGGLAAIGAFAGTSAAPVVGQTFRDAYAETGDANKAANEALAAGAVTVVTSTLPGMAILSKTPIGKAIVGKAAETALYRVGASALAEGTQEAIEQIGQETATALIRHDQSLSADTAASLLFDPAKIEEYARAGVLGAIGGGAAHLAVHGAEGHAAPEGVSEQQPQEPTNEEGQEEGRQEGLLSPEAATTPEAATPGADKPPAPADRVGMAYRSELKRMGYSETEIDGMDRAKALEIIRGQQRAFEGFVGSLEQAPAGGADATAQGLVPERDGGGAAAEERPVEDGGGVAGAEADTGGGVDQPGAVRAVADRVPAVVGDEGLASGDQPGDVAVEPGTAKQPWEMTRAEWIGNGKVGHIRFGDVDQETISSPEFDTPEEASAWAKSRGIKNASVQSQGKRGGPKKYIATGSTGWHADAVERAISEGRPVPPEVLADYPDLSARASDTEPGTPTTVPERPETIKAQLDELKAGKRPAVLVTPGAKAAVPPKGMKALRTKAGRFIYDPSKIGPDEITAAVREDRIGDVLGYGIPNKPAAENVAGVVTVRDENGVEKRSVVTDSQNMANVVAEAQKVAEPGDTVAVESPEMVLRDRASVENNQGVEERDYRMGHRPNPDGPRAFDLNETDLAPDDIYNNPHYYVGDSKDKASRESINAIRAIRGKPDAIVTVYRAAPAGSSLNAGDWVSLSKTYAKRHGMDDSDSSKDMPVISTKVRASDIRWAGDDLNEFGYYPDLSRDGQAPGTQKGAEARSGAQKDAQRPVAKMKNSELRAELEAAGVEVPEGTKRKALVSGVEQLRAMPKEVTPRAAPAQSPAVAETAVARGNASEWNAELAKSPRGKQWLAFKKRQPGVMLAFRIGDFYEFFAEDAVAAHKAAGLTLTQRSSGVPMAGVPYSQVEQYLRKFIGAGLKVALVEPTDAAEAKAAARPELPAPSKQTSGQVVFGESRSATEYGGRVKKAVAVLLTDADGNTARRLDLVKDGFDWDIMEADEPTMVKMGSQSIRKQTYSNLGTVIGDLRRAKEVAERVIRGELDPKARVEVKPGFEPDASFANAWRGSTPTEDTSLITDGTILVKADALKPKMAERLRASEHSVYRSPVSKNSTDAIWNDTIKKSVSPATLVGYAPDLNNDVAVFDLGGSVMALNAAKFKMIADSTGADAFRAESPKKALVLMKAGKPVAIIMPINLGDRAPVLSTGGPAVSERIVAKADAVEKAARARIAKRQIPRGRNVGAVLSPQEIIDYGIIVAARATKFGVRSSLMLRDTAKRLIENDYPQARDHLLDIIRVADSIIRKSYDDAGRFSQKRLDSAIAEVEARQTEIPPVADVVDRARRETAGERTIGRPDLANPAEDEQARRVVDAVDQARTEAGQPEARTDSQVVAEADARLGGDYEAERRSLLEKADKGQLLTDTDTVVAQKLVSDAAFKAVSNGDENAMLQAITLADAYRETGSQAARAFRQRRDRFKSPARRHAEYVGELIATPSQAGRRKLASINDRLRKADSPKASESIKAEKDAVLRREASKAKKIQKRLRDMGIDPASINDETIADPKRAAAIARAISTAKASGYDMATEYWINAILSGPQTHAANTIGNLAYGAWRTFGERAIEAGIADVARAFGADFKGKAPTTGEFKAIFESLGPALTRASQNFVRAFRDETPVLEEQVRTAGGETPGGSGSKLELPETRAAIPGKTGRAVRTPTRSLLAADEFFKGLWGTMDAYARGYRRAVEVEGLRGEAAMRRAGEHAMDLSSPAWEEALSYAEDVSFQGEPGAIVKQVLALRNRAPFLRYIIPFVTTPTNILKAGLERTPLVSLRSLAKLANTGAVKLGYGKQGWTYNRTNIAPELTKNIVGWGALLALKSLAGGKDDDELPFITGSTPRDRGRRDAMYRTVPPMSIRIGDRWFSYARIEPFATAIATSVDAIDAMNRAQSGEEYMSAFGAALASTTRQIDDKSFLQGIADIMDAVKNEDGNGSKALQYGANFASSWVPSIIKQGLRSADPNVRDATVKTTKDRGTAEAVAMTTAYRTIPQIASPRVDLWGREISARNWESGVPGTDFVYRLLSPIRTQDLDSASKLDLLLLRYNNDPKNAESMWFPVPPSPTFTRKERGKNVTYTMTEQEYHDFLVASGKRAAERLSKARLNYGEPSERDIAIIKKYISDERESARDKIIIRRRKGGADER